MSVRAALRGRIENELQPEADGARWVAGIIGDRPSNYAKSPSLWNAAFQELGVDAHFASFDVEPANLAGVVEALRGEESYVGGSVTVPYKVAILEHLDGVDPMAERIGAVNTLVREADGRIVGYNTDGQGGIDSLTVRLPGQSAAFLPKLEGARVILIGTGGAGRALAWYLREAIGAGGEMILTNRDQEKGRELADAVDRVFGSTRCIPQEDLAEVIGEADLIVNASTRGQYGIRRLPGGRLTCLEGYSSLAPAEPAEVDAAQPHAEARFHRLWLERTREDMARNHAISLATVARAREGAAFFDAIYAPLESEMLRHARLAGHPTLNGRGMNIAQAADAFARRVMPRPLARQGESVARLYEQAFEVMARVW